MEKNNVEELAQKLINMANDFDAKHVKELLLKELDSIENASKRVPCISALVQGYPDFDHIEVKVTEGDVFAIRFCINPEVIKLTPETAYALAEMCEQFRLLGAKEEDEGEIK